MNKLRQSKGGKRKGAGHPATGTDPHIPVRMPPAQIKIVEAWARSNSCNRSEAIRRLVDWA
jgi:hypothetical protein